MRGIIVVSINGEETDINELPTETREKLVEEWNRRALEAIGYQRVKTA